MSHQPTVVDNTALIDHMERQLSLLAYHWRSSGDPSLVSQYHTILTAMIDLGFTDELSPDAELPDEHLPTAYLALHGG